MENIHPHIVLLFIGRILISILITIGCVQLFIYWYFFNVTVAISSDIISTQFDYMAYYLLTGTVFIPDNVAKEILNQIDKISGDGTINDQVIAHNTEVRNAAFNYVISISLLCFVGAFMVYTLLRLYTKEHVYETYGEFILVILKVLVIFLAYFVISYVFIRSYVPLAEKDIDGMIMTCIK